MLLSVLLVSIQKLAVLKSSFILGKPSGNYSPQPTGSVNSFSPISPTWMDQQSRPVLIKAMQKIKRFPRTMHKRHRGAYGKGENSITAWRQEMCWVIATENLTLHGAAGAVSPRWGRTQLPRTVSVTEMKE